MCTHAAAIRTIALYSPECVEEEFSEVELPLYGVLGRWDEKADPLRSTLWVCKQYTGSNGPIGRRIGPPWMVANSDRR
jgi:hypothetical protein